MEELSKILFGTSDQDLTALLKQLNVVKSSVGTVNNILTDIEFNEKSITEGNMDLQDYKQELEGESRKKRDTFNAKVEIEGHILRVNNAMNAIQSNVDMLINSIVNAQKGMVQPQVIKSAPAFLEDIIKQGLSSSCI
jgi:Fic family protein